MIVQANGRHYEAFRILRSNQAYNASTPPEVGEQDQRTSGEAGEPQARGNG